MNDLLSTHKFIIPLTYIDKKFLMNIDFTSTESTKSLPYKGLHV